jgi:hypothetical protein
MVSREGRLQTSLAILWTGLPDEYGLSGPPPQYVEVRTRHIILVLVLPPSLASLAVERTSLARPTSLETNLIENLHHFCSFAGSHPLPIRSRFLACFVRQESPLRIRVLMFFRRLYPRQCVFPERTPSPVSMVIL